MADKFKFGKNVLAVDDQETNQMVMDGILKYYYGIEASFANNGQEAVDMVSRGDYDLIFMDVNMPVMNGIEATRAIIRENPTMAIVAITTNTLPEDSDECYKVGMMGYLSIPINLEALKKVIELYVLD
jgi:CheY-like chemotaxis protein